VKVPFVDLTAQYLSIKEEIDREIGNVLMESAFIRGKYVEKFEKEFGMLHGDLGCLSCASGTDALYISLKALDVGIGDEVITTAMSWISTSQTISQTGAQPVFIDVDPRYFTIDPGQIEEKITENTKAIIPVHLYGQPADMTAILKIANKYGIYVLEDCAQAHFSRYRKDVVGSMGIAGTFSFYPGKNLGAYGDAGAIISGDLDFLSRARMFANHGSLNKHKHEIEGINSRMDGIQAAILSTKLKHIENWTVRRIALSENYRELLSQSVNVKLPLVRQNCRHVFHLFVIRSTNRDILIKKLRARGIACQIHYPVALPFLKPYKNMDHKPEEFPVAHRIQSEILSLPLYPELTPDMQQYVAECVNECDF
jgi:dTDP-4-amino-4,6-dideoxygalactose transaminase